MNDQFAQDPQQQTTTTSSYVDDYVPPTDDANLKEVPLDDVTPRVDSQFKQAFKDDTNKDDSSVVVVEENPLVNDIVSDASFLKKSDDSVADGGNVDDANSNADKDGADSTNSYADDDVSDEDIEKQNIFSMLGVEDGADDLKEKFLTQLQDVIWEDFLTNDVELLLTKDELVEFKKYREKADSLADEAQEKAKDEMVEYLEKLIPDLEDILLEKALDLKSDLFVERIKSMKDYFAQDSTKLETISKAEQLMYEDKWRSAALVLNGIEE